MNVLVLLCLVILALVSSEFKAGRLDFHILQARRRGSTLRQISG